MITNENASTISNDSIPGDDHNWMLAEGRDQAQPAAETPTRPKAKITLSPDLGLAFLICPFHLGMLPGGGRHEN